MMKRTMLAVLAGLSVAGFAAPTRAAGLLPGTLRCEYLVEPLGVGAQHPRLSWTLTSDQRGAVQSAYQVVVASAESKLDAPDLWDSGKVASPEQNQIAYLGKALGSRQPCVWRVRSWDGSGQPGPWSAVGHWEMGLLAPTDWHAAWIVAPAIKPAQPVRVVRAVFETERNRGAEQKVTKDVTEVVRGLVQEGVLSTPVNPGALGGDPAADRKKVLRLRYSLGDGPEVETVYHENVQLDLPPQPMCDLHRSFHVDRPVTRARLYASAQGVYELRLNGQVAGDHTFAPDWTDYNKRARYQVYDVTKLVRQGDNTIGGMVAHGWYSGHIGNGGYQFWGKKPAVMAQLELTHDDGSVQTITTDDGWRARPGPILASDMMNGEDYDARVVTDASAGDGWAPVAVRTEKLPPVLDPQVTEPVRELMTLKPKSVKEAAPGHWVFDLGQNMVGVPRIRVAAPAGTKVTIRFAEMLNKNGTIYTANYRGAKSIDNYICKGGGDVEQWQPRFTFHGFRYVELTGLPGQPLPDAVTGVVLGSDTPNAGDFACSNPDINQLQSNIRWGQRGNYLSVPTDCPQRDERMGWMGDAGVFVGTAVYNADVAAFFTKWLVDVDDEQTADGRFSDTAPEIGRNAGGAPAWADAGVICPWTIYRTYGDTRILQQHLPAMKRWVDYCTQQSDGYIRSCGRNADFGDWLSIKANTSKEMLGTAYYAHSADLLARSYRAVGDNANAAKYADLYRKICDAFVAKYGRPGDHIDGDTQTSYAMSLAFGLLPEPSRAAAANHLAQAVHAKDDHLSTGFLGVSFLLPALSNFGHTDVAYRLLLQDTFPSWLFSVRQGATTIWERWDGWTPNKGFQDAGMNSFNHYSLGSCGQWLYEQAAGIAQPADGAGFARVVISPRVLGPLTSVTAHYDSIRGRIGVNWKVADGHLALDVDVPTNVTATVHVPTSAPASVTESGTPADHAAGVKPAGTDAGAAVFEVGSGHYHFVADAPKAE